MRKLLRLRSCPIVPLLVTLLAVEMGIAVIVEAILSFVGLSVAGDTPTWGGMIAEGRQIIYQAPWIMALPIGCIIATVSASICSATACASRSIRCSAR